MKTQADAWPRCAALLSTTPLGAHLQWIRTSVVARYGNPFTGCWPDVLTPITREEIDDCLAHGREALHAPFEWSAREAAPGFIARRRCEHVEKTAWFVRHGFREPLEMDVGCPVLNYHVRHKVLDGNHRLAAAIYRLDRYGEDPLLPLLIGGEIEHAIRLGLWNEDETFSKAF